MQDTSETSPAPAGMPKAAKERTGHGNGPGFGCGKGRGRGGTGRGLGRGHGACRQARAKLAEKAARRAAEQKCRTEPA